MTLTTQKVTNTKCEGSDRQTIATKSDTPLGLSGCLVSSSLYWFRLTTAMHQSPLWRFLFLPGNSLVGTIDSLLAFEASHLPLPFVCTPLSLLLLWLSTVGVVAVVVAAAVVVASCDFHFSRSTMAGSGLRQVWSETKRNETRTKRKEAEERLGTRQGGRASRNQMLTKPSTGNNLRTRMETQVKRFTVRAASGVTTPWCSWFTEYSIQMDQHGKDKHIDGYVGR